MLSHFNTIKVVMITVVTISAYPLLAQPGAVDTSFNPTGTPGLIFFGDLSNNERVLDMEVDSLGRVVVLYSSFPAPVRGLFTGELVVTRLLDTGTVDLTFATGGFHEIELPEPSLLEFDPSLSAIAIGPADEIYIGYSERPIAGPPVRRLGPTGNVDFKVAKLSAAGMPVLDVTFGFDLITDGEDRLLGLEVCGSSLYAVGSARASATEFSSDVAVARLNTATLALDTSFSSDGKTTIAVDEGGDDSDGAEAVACFGNSIWVAGFAEGADDIFQGLLVSLDQDGSLNNDFGGNGVKTYRAPALGWPSAGSQRRAGVTAVAQATFFTDLLVDQNGLLWVAGGADNIAGDLDAVILVTDLTGVIVTSEGEGGWQGVGSTTLDGSPPRGIPPTVSTTDFAVGIFETGPGEITVVAAANYFNMTVAITYGFAFRLTYPGAELDPSFNGDGDSDGIVHSDLLETGTVWAAAADRHGRILVGGDRFEASPGDLRGWIGRIHGNDLFVDGFESGNTDAWSSQSP